MTVSVCGRYRVSVETRRSDDLYTGASPDGDGVVDLDSTGSEDPVFVCHTHGHTAARALLC